MTNIQKCGVIGVGFVGATCAYTLAVSGLFSDLVLVDMNRGKAIGEAADINHGVAFSKPCRVMAGDYADLAECGLIIIAAGANQKPGGTVLDTARLKYLLGQRLGVDSRNVHAFIIGEHGDSELAVWSSANISGADLDDYCRIAGITKPADELSRIYEHVRDAAYQIIDSKGATYYGIGMAVRRIAEAIVRNEHSVLPVTSMIYGHYGVDGICLGVPTIVGRNGAEAVLDIPLSEEELAQLQRSANTMREMIDKLDG